MTCGRIIIKAFATKRSASSRHEKASVRLTNWPFEKAYIGKVSLVVPDDNVVFVLRLDFVLRFHATEFLSVHHEGEIVS